MLNYTYDKYIYLRILKLNKPKTGIVTKTELKKKRTQKKLRSYQSL